MGASSLSNRSRDPRLEFHQNGLPDTFRRAHQVAVSEAQRFPAVLLQGLVAMHISVVAVIVRIAVEFDHEAGFDAREIGEIRPDWMLPPPVVAFHVMRPQQLPQHGFIRRLALTQFAGAGYFRRFLCGHGNEVGVVGGFGRGSNPRPNPPPPAGEGGFGAYPDKIPNFSVAEKRSSSPAFTSESETHPQRPPFPRAGKGWGGGCKHSPNTSKSAS